MKAELELRSKKAVIPRQQRDRQGSDRNSDKGYGLCFLLPLRSSSLFDKGRAKHLPDTSLGLICPGFHKDI